MTTYFNGRPTKRALDAGDSAAFSSIFLASSFSCSQAESTPAPAPVTQTVRRLPSKIMPSVFENFISNNGHVISKETIWRLNGYIHWKT